jgi:chorismate mutase
MSNERDDLEELRRQIDALDETLLRLLAERMKVARQIGSYKKAHDLSVADPARMEAVLAVQQAKAQAADLPEEYIKQLYEIIYKYTIEVEAETE